MKFTIPHDPSHSAYCLTVRVPGGWEWIGQFDDSISCPTVDLPPDVSEDMVEAFIEPMSNNGRVDPGARKIVLKSQKRLRRKVDRGTNTRNNGGG